MLNNSEMGLEYIESSGNTSLYENKYPLSIGFMMNDSILDLPDKEGTNPFEYQNDLMSLATGTDSNIFTAQPVALVSYNNIDVTKTGYGTYNFHVPNSNKPASVSYDFAGVEGAYLYGYAKNGGVETVNVKCDGINADSSVSVKDYPVVFPMGNGQSGSTSTAELKITEDKTDGNYTIMVYALKQNVFEQAYNKLADEQLQLTEFADTEIRGNINAYESGILYLSIPYEKGWSVYIDGKKTDTFKVLDSMLGVKVDSGEHEVLLKYSPEGFKLGLIISGGALLLFILLVFMERKSRKFIGELKKNEESQSDDCLQGNELPRLSEAEQCIDSSGSSGEGSLESTERESDDNGLFED